MKSFSKLISIFVVVLSILYVTQPSFAAADTGDGISTTLCSVVTMLTGTVGKAVATIAVVVLGIGLFLGKLSWGVALATAIGIGMIFGAGTIVSYIGGTAAGAAGDCPPKA